MKSLSTPPPSGNIVAAVESQLRDFFGGGVQLIPNDFAVLLHGSVLDRRAWSRKGRSSDVDLLVIQPALSQERLVTIYRRLRALDLPGGPIRLDTRIGPLDGADDIPDGAIVVQAAVCSSYNEISPATLQILAYGAHAIVGSPPDAEGLRRYDVATLQGWLERDVADISAIVVDHAIPYWTLSDDPKPHRIRALHVPRTAAELGKAQRHARAKLHSWSLLALSCGVERLCGLGPSEMITLAGTVEDRHVFETVLAKFLARSSCG
jgi:hypothetical protein